MRSADVANPHVVIAALLKHVKQRRDVINTSFPKHLSKKGYAKLVGQHEELQNLETLLDDAIARANAADQSHEEDET